MIGAGVAGLAAIGAARGLGAIVRAFDTRAAVKEQVKSMGAEFIELDVHEEGEGGGGYAKEMSPAFIKAEMAMFAAQAREVDIIITTALIPNRPAPVLITEEMVKSMKRGSVIVDLAAENGGNCALTKPGQVVEHHGVHIIGYIDLPSRLAPTASHLYGNNLVHLLTDMGGAKQLRRRTRTTKSCAARSCSATACSSGRRPRRTRRRHRRRSRRRRRRRTGPRPDTATAPRRRRRARRRRWRRWSPPALLTGLGLVAPGEFLSHFTVFVLACVVGWQVIWNVTPALHTPLMSVTNAISGIILVGGMLQVGGPPGSLMTVLGAAAILLATINVVGGFMVTQRMLRMFRR